MPIAWAVIIAAVLPFAAEPSEGRQPSQLVGVWRGTSTCTDRVAAPACRDEVVVYEFAIGKKPGTVGWKADKVVNGEREPMGDQMELRFDLGKGCWRGEFRNARVHIVWCLLADHDHMTGSAWVLPGKQIVRRVDLRRE